MTEDSTAFPENTQDNHDVLEKKMARLETILEQFENPNLSLEDSVKLFQEGVSLQAECQKLLDDLKLRITKITESSQDSTTANE